jgi:hypothetical protein
MRPVLPCFRKPDAGSVQLRGATCSLEEQHTDHLDIPSLAMIRGEVKQPMCLPDARHATSYIVIFNSNTALSQR